MVGLLVLGTTLVGNPVLPLVTADLIPPGELVLHLRGTGILSAELVPASQLKDINSLIFLCRQS